MKDLVGTLVPPMIALAATGWAVWPYLESPVPSPISRTRVAEISSDSLATVPGRTPDRDPFSFTGSSAADESADATKSGPGGRAPKARPADAILKVGRAEVDILAALPGKVSLSATSIHDSRRMAVLNGRVYAEGESVQGLDAPGPVVLAAIHPASVGLRYGGKDVEIAFPASSTMTRPPSSIASSPPIQAKQDRKRGKASKSNSVRRTTRPR
ncbi:hypothetical protein [Paludisphaera mucosa]|uniref:Type II secretion system protein GspC N-terminal domain-containing protein n=1 Tax=Paludisphaera mucosa TaxID=3030827 RepID=A0ABT6FJM5_9BACT|nr:hypothetical protein [Paludisphaera mucosa]MDG3007709.1 hypothetical protein [Paludisphaera mucosa]